MFAVSLWSVCAIGGVIMASSHRVWAQEGAPASHSAHAPDAAEEALEREHGARHGGYFGDAEDLFHYEVLLQEGRRLLLYVNDDRNAPLDVLTLKGRWRLNPDDAEPVSGVLTPSEDGAYFWASLPELPSTDILHVEVAVQKDGAWVPMEFYLPRPEPLAAQPDLGHARAAD